MRLMRWSIPSTVKHRSRDSWLLQTLDCFAALMSARGGNVFPMGQIKILARLASQQISVSRILFGPAPRKIFQLKLLSKTLNDQIIFMLAPNSRSTCRMMAASVLRDAEAIFPL